MHPCPLCNSSSSVYQERLYDDRYGYPGFFNLYECQSCKHLFLDARFSGQELIDLYSKYYPRASFNVDSYQPYIRSSFWKEWFNGEKRAVSFVPKNVRVLDIGCGWGDTVGYHQSRGCDAYGVETDRNVEAVAKKYGLKIKIGVFNPDFFEEHYFDYVTMDQVLEHSLDPLNSLRGIRKVLKKGGFFIATFPNARGWGAKKYGAKWLHWHVPYHLQFFSRNSLQIAGERTGFKISSIQMITSSEWLFYQKLHLLTYPKAGRESLFWGKNSDWSRVDAKLVQGRDQLQNQHQSKVNHLLTRWMDGIGMGDNFLVTFKAV